MADREWSLDTLQQWQRVMLCLGRLRGWQQESLQQIPPLYDLDVASFFLHCHHLGDYIEHFDKVDVASYMRSDPAPSLCRDVAVDLKHAAIRSRPWGAGDPQRTVNVSLTINVDDDDVVTIAGGTVGLTVAGRDAFELAQEASLSWLRFGLPRRVALLTQGIKITDA